MIDEMLLKAEEIAVFSLRALYRKYGYLPYKMSRFEEYDLYAGNKDFLVSDRIITFNDTRGRLMALKPDVTLSIIKNGVDRPGCKQRLCYSENVYRVSDSSGQFKEILQAGLECIGDLDSYDLCEVVTLAGLSLAMIDENYVLEISHLGLMSALLDAAGAEERLRREITACFASKNTHDLERICREAGIDPERIEELCFFAGLSGDLGQVIAELSPRCESRAARAALAELEGLEAMLRGGPCEGRIRFDFSVVSNMKYYNGLVFRGFLPGIPTGVLAGGQYDRLMRRMGREAGGIGFALYLDLLELREQPEEAPDVDILLLYDDPAEACAAVRRLTGEGKRVSAQRAVPEKLRWSELLDLRGGGADA